MRFARGESWVDYIRWAREEINESVHRTLAAYLELEVRDRLKKRRLVHQDNVEERERRNPERQLRPTTVRVDNGSQCLITFPHRLERKDLPLKGRGPTRKLFKSLWQPEAHCQYGRRGRRHVGVYCEDQHKVLVCGVSSAKEYGRSA